MNLRILYTIPPDYPERWKQWTRKFRGKGSVRRIKALHAVDKILVVFFVALYLLLAWGCIKSAPAAIIGYVVSTAICFVVVSLFRARHNEPRPYEVFDIKPLVAKKDLKSGKSFPSRHTFSAFLIATMAATIFQSFVSIFVLILAGLLGAIRVLEGVHFIRDVTAGALIGIICGFLCIGSLLVALL